MRIFLVICFLLGAALQACAEEHYHLVKILVSGSQAYSREDVARATGLKEDSIVTLSQLEAGAKRLGDSGVFASVEYHFRPAAKGSGIEALFQVKDAEKFLPTEFENFVWWSDHELETSLREALPLYKGRLGLKGNLGDEVAAALGNMLSAKGLDRKVVWQQWAAPGELPSVYRFKVTNGVPSIKSVKLVGAGHLPADVESRFTAAVVNGSYLRSDIQKNIQRILKPAYRERGYINFASGAIEPEVAEDKTLTVSIPLEEGPQYKLAGYTWSGNTVATAEQLSKFITLPAGQPVNLPRLEANLESARKFLGKFGREAAVINPLARFSGENVTYDFQVSEGDLYRMGDLDVEGLESAAAQKVREFWKLAPGSPYDNTYAPNFVDHLIMRKSGSTASFICEFLEQEDDSQKLVNVQLRFKSD